jgi:peroxiredoxin
MPRRNRFLATGAAAPDFRLRAANDEQVDLWSCLIHGPVCIEFVRGTWCPNARRRLVELAGARGEFRALHARILVVVCEDPFTVKRYLARRPSPLTVLIDQARDVARAYGVHVRFGLDGFNVARPASFVVDRAGFVRLEFVAAMQTETCALERLLATLRDLEEERGGAPA